MSVGMKCQTTAPELLKEKPQESVVLLYVLGASLRKWAKLKAEQRVHSIVKLQQ